MGFAPVMRRLLGFVVFVLLVVAAVPAWAGGSWLRFDREAYAPGEIAQAEARPGHGQLGWVDDGPFYAYLTDSLAVPAEEGIPLGELLLDEETVNSVRVTIEFVVPDVPPGEYAVVYCNNPCTEGLGDLIGGVLNVVPSATLPNTGVEQWPLVSAGMLILLGAAALYLSRARGERAQSPNR